MGFFGKMLAAAAHVALTPVAVIVDAKNVLTGEPVTATKDRLTRAVDNVDDAIEELEE